MVKVWHRVRAAIHAVDLASTDLCTRDKLAALVHWIWLIEVGTRVNQFTGPEKAIVESFIKPWNELAEEEREYSYRWADRIFEILEEPEDSDAGQ